MNRADQRRRARTARAPVIVALLVAWGVFSIDLLSLHSGFVHLDDQTYVVNKPVSNGLTIDGLTFAFTSLIAPTGTP